MKEISIQKLKSNVYRQVVQMLRSEPSRESLSALEQFLKKLENDRVKELRDIADTVFMLGCDSMADSLDEQADKLIHDRRLAIKENVVTLRLENLRYIADATWLCGSPPTGRGATIELAIQDLRQMVKAYPYYVSQWPESLEYTVRVL